MIGIPIEVLNKLEGEIIGVLKQGVDPDYITAYLTLLKIKDVQENWEMYEKMTSSQGGKPVQSTNSGRAGTTPPSSEPFGFFSTGRLRGLF